MSVYENIYAVCDIRSENTIVGDLKITGKVHFDLFRLVELVYCGKGKRTSLWHLASADDYLS